ncbi:hypothetical protein K2173_001243 [Erythroxylum novogranatense]|uniref:ARM repeat superfamily protein n=1 Tax=Erythroxylum novogranatense TaxID=1862640 RepID=A0AAV8T354_9ROSI|nr:hypothetical protein K2173_001243 [Erythroxylum novogranatense]
MEDFGQLSCSFGQEAEQEGHKSDVFSQLKTYCLELLQLLQNPKNHSPAIPLLLQFLRGSSSDALQPFFDYTLFPLLLILDAATDCRSQKKVNPEKKDARDTAPKVTQKVSDQVAEGILQCLEELLIKCQLMSTNQMAVLIKKLTYAALLSPSEASEEFRGGVIKCFRALLMSILPCSRDACSCRQVVGLPALLGKNDTQLLQFRASKYVSLREECLLAFFQSEMASATVGHWLSLLLKAADMEAARGHQGNAKIRADAFVTLRLLVAKVGTADALAFFLPGVVSQFAKVLYVSKQMITGAAGSVEALDQAIRGLAEYLMIVLEDDANLSSLDKSKMVRSDFNLSNNESGNSFLNELRRLPTSTQGQRTEESNGESHSLAFMESGMKLSSNTEFFDKSKSLHVDRTKDWIQKTSMHVDKLLTATFPHICVNPSEKVRRGLMAAIRGLLSKCNYTLKDSRLMLLECICVLVVDDSEEVSAPAQEFLEWLLSSASRDMHSVVAEIFNRLIEKLPKVMLGNEEALALSHAHKLLVITYYMGPKLLLDHLRSPVTAAQFLDVFAICLSQHSVYTGALDKFILARPSSVGYLQSIADLKAGPQHVAEFHIVEDAVPSHVSKLRDISRHAPKYLLENMHYNYELPHIPPWFGYVGCPKLYEALAGILRLVGLSLTTDFEDEGLLSVVVDIPLGYLRKLISEVRTKECNNESCLSWYNRIGSGQLLRQASVAACILNEMIFGLSDKALDKLRRKLEKSRSEQEVIQAHDTSSGCHSAVECPKHSVWKLSLERASRIHLIDCVGRILNEYLSSEIWDLPEDPKSSLEQHDYDEITLHFFQDTTILHQVIVEGLGIFAICLGNEFASSGFLHSSLYLLLESLICSSSDVKIASDAVLHVISTASGCASVAQLVFSNADYIIDSICQQLRHLDLNPHVPDVLASMLSYVGVADKILPLLEDPMRSASQELEILGRHQHPELTGPFMKAVVEVTKALKCEASSLPDGAKSYLAQIKGKISDVKKDTRQAEIQGSIPRNDYDMHPLQSDLWESIVLKLNDSKRYRRTIGSIASSCLTAATPLLASIKQSACLVALDIIENGIATLAKVEEACTYDKETKEIIGEILHLNSLHEAQDTLDACDEGTDGNRLLPAMNNIWPFLVVCVQNRDPVVVRRCLSVVGNVVYICGGDFFSRRFHVDGQHFWKLLSSSAFHTRPLSAKERTPLQLPYRSNSTLSEECVAEVSNLKVQVAVLNMIATLCRSSSASALESVLKKVSGLATGVACSSVTALHEASVNALHALATIDPDLIWLLLADVYFSMKKKHLPSPPSSDFSDISQIVPPPLSPKDYLYVQYSGQSYGFDINLSAVENVFKKLHCQVFTYQMYV